MMHGVRKQVRRDASCRLRPEQLGRLTLTLIAWDYFKTLGLYLWDYFKTLGLYLWDYLKTLGLYPWDYFKAPRNHGVITSHTAWCSPPKAAKLHVDVEMDPDAHVAQCVQVSHVAQGVQVSHAHRADHGFMHGYASMVVAACLVALLGFSAASA